MNIDPVVDFDEALWDALCASPKFTTGLTQKLYMLMYRKTKSSLRWQKVENQETEKTTRRENFTTLQLLELLQRP